MITNTLKHLQNDLSNNLNLSEVTKIIGFFLQISYTLPKFKPLGVFMKTFSTQFKAIDTSTDLTTFKTLLENSEVKVTFWGTRTIQLKKCKGSESLFNVADKAHSIAKEAYAYGNENSANYKSLTPEKRLNGIAIAQQLKAFYIETDKELEKKNPFTQLLASIQDFVLEHFFGHGKAHFDTNRPEEATEYYFRGYSKQDFFKQFHTDEKTYQKSPSYYGSSLDDNTLLAKASHIRGLDPTHNPGLMGILKSWLTDD